MSEKIKNYLGIAVIITLLVLSGSAWFLIKTYSRSIEPSSFRSFSVSAEGKITALPDVAQFTFSIITQGGTNIAELMKENTKKVNAAIDFVKSLGVEQKDVKTQNYNLEPRYQYFSCPRDEVAACPPAEIAGYTITQTVLVKIRDFAKIGDLLAGVIKNGANSVSQLSFTIDDQTVLQDQAREQAIEKAKERAKKIAKAGGFRLGRLLSIDENVAYPYITPLSFGMAAEQGIAKSLPSPTIEPGSQEITVNATLRYEIE
ncbi:MAG: SIMPL domain-containing protein [Patescibacteria group bacterium]